MDPAPVEEIVIVAPRLPEAPGERAYSTADIDPITLADAPRIDDALRTAPGVSLFRRTSSAIANPTIQGLSVRASGPSGAGRTLVTLDGQPLNDPFGGWVIWGALPPDTVARARVLRGAGAGPYGAGALLGVVQLQERDQDGAALSVESGERGHLRASGLAVAGDETISLLLAASAEESDGWVAVRDGLGAADVALAAESSAAAARLSWRDADHALSLRISGYGESRSAGLAGADSQNSGSSLSVALARPYGAWSWRVQGWAMWSDLANSSVAVSPDRSATTPANDQIATPAFGWGGNAALRWTDESAGVELGADVRMADGETRELFRFVGGTFTRTRVAGGETRMAGAYVEAWREGNDWLLSGGARVDQWEASRGARTERDRATNAILLDFRPSDNAVVLPTARLGVRRDLGDDAYLRAAAYAGFRPPTLNELHRPFRVGNDVTEANAALEPERLTGVDAAIGSEGEAFSWEIGAFATQLEDAIVNLTLGAGPGTFPPGVFVPAGGAYRQRRNAGEIDARGIEAEANGAWRTLTWRVAANYTRAEIAGLRPAQAPEWAATGSLRWNAGTATTLSAHFAYESARFEDDLNSRELSPALTVDLRAEHALLDGLSVFAALDNAFDAAVETAETADGIESFDAPRTLRFGLRWRSPG
ncbi:MAG: TonB-dependent receptor [Hyphomonadaceae bacterium]|nr:TonB-dependent receptor [Hyphomonadaceae bacterium]